jgi:uncharacterized protein YciI
MLYMIFAQDVPESLMLRQANRAAHLERLEALQNEGRLYFAGPLPKVDSEEPGTAGMQGSLILAEFTTQAAAQAWAAQDPYWLAGVYQQVQVYPVKKVFPTEQ